MKKYLVIGNPIEHSLITKITQLLDKEIINLEAFMKKNRREIEKI